VSPPPAPGAITPGASGGGAQFATHASHPVDVVTGRAFTHPITEIGLPGPLSPNGELHLLHFQPHTD
jgi:hypothetical protein